MSWLQALESTATVNSSRVLTGTLANARESKSIVIIIIIIIMDTLCNDRIGKVMMYDMYLKLNPCMHVQIIGVGTYSRLRGPEIQSRAQPARIFDHAHISFEPRPFCTNEAVWRGGLRFLTYTTSCESTRAYFVTLHEFLSAGSVSQAYAFAARIIC